jgi:hypothetical protein
MHANVACIPEQRRHMIATRSEFRFDGLRDPECTGPTTI